MIIVSSHTDLAQSYDNRPSTKGSPQHYDHRRQKLESHNP